MSACSSRFLCRWLVGIALLNHAELLLGQDNTVFLESFSTDGDTVRYDMIGRGSDTSPDAWEHTFALAQSETFPLGPGGNITLAAPRVAIPWHSSIDNATSDAFPLFDSALAWATNDAANLDISFLVKDNPTDSNLDPGDAAVFDRLTSTLGHSVNLLDATSATPEGVAASDLLLISDSVNIGNIYKSINVREVDVPVVNYSADLTDDLLLTFSPGSVQQLQGVDVRDPSTSVLPGGLTQDQTIALTDAKTSMPEYSQPRPGVSVPATFRGPFARGVSNLATVDAMLDGTAASTTATTTISDADLVDSSDPATGIWAVDNEIPGGGGNNYAVVSRGTITVSEAGSYVFGVGGDDGGRLRINGEDVIVDDATHGFRYETESIELDAGEHEIEWVGFESGGGAGFELSFAPAAEFTGSITVEESDVVTTAPFFDQVTLNEPGLEVTAHYLDVANSPDVTTNNPAMLAAPAGLTFNLPLEPFSGPVGDYVLGTDMNGIPGNEEGFGILQFPAQGGVPIDLSGVANPKLSMNVASTFSMEEDDGLVIFVNDEEFVRLQGNELGILVDEATGTLLTSEFRTLTWDLPAGLTDTSITVEVGALSSSGEAIGIDEIRITDGDPDPASVLVPTVPENRIQQGVNGYDGLEDTEVRFSDPDGDLSEKLFLNPDGADGGGEVHGLTRFNDIIGDGENQIPADAEIAEATLNINITGPGTPLSLHRMLLPWEDDTATWNEFMSGIQADDIEAKAEPDDVQTANTGIASWDITESIRAWQADPDSNFGWVLLPLGTNGVDYLSAEAIELDTGDIQVAPYIDFFLAVGGGTLDGDLDGDGSVGFPDFLILSANFGNSVNTVADGDIDGDGTVGFPDFLVLSANFGQSAAAAAVPEPTGFGLGLFSLLSLVARRRRR